MCLFAPHFKWSDSEACTRFAVQMFHLLSCSSASIGHIRRISGKTPRIISTSLWVIWAVKSMTGPCMRPLFTVATAQMLKSNGIMQLAGKLIFANLSLAANIGYWQPIWPCTALHTHCCEIASISYAHVQHFTASLHSLC